MKLLDHFTKVGRHRIACRRAGIMPLHEVFSGKWFPAMEDTDKADEKLSLREIICLHHNECPDCGGEIRWGPRGPGFQNVKCFGECGAKLMLVNHQQWQ